MNNFKVKFADVLRYAVLGIIEILVLYMLFRSLEQNVANIPWIHNTVSWIEYYISNTSLPLVSTLGAVVAICIAYFMGYVTQTILQTILAGNFFGTGIEEIANYIRFYPLFPFNKTFPGWLYWSDEPDLVLKTYKDKMETSPNSENLTEFLSSNQLFQGLAFFLLITSSILFACLAPFRPALIVLFLIVLVLAICAYISRTMHVVYSVLVGRYVLLLLLVLLPYCSIGHWGLGIFFSSGMLCCIIFAEFLSRNQIRRIDILANTDSLNSVPEASVESLNQTLLKYGIPKFYILTRTNTHQFLSEQLDSIAKQTYPNIKIIILIDSILAKGSSIEQIKRIISQKSEEQNLNIQYYESDNTGPAALADEIRRIFCDYANKDDYAMLLDADDLLASHLVISQIVTKMMKTQSDICLIRFEIFGDKKLNYSKNYHNDLVKKYCYRIIGKERYDKRLRPHSRYDRYITPQFIIKESEMHHFSTIGWTKCCKKPVIEDYLSIWTKIKEGYRSKWNEIKISHKEAWDKIEKSFEKQKKNIPENERDLFFLLYRKYEDFPDIVMLLKQDRRICTVSKNSVKFRKTNSSVTADVDSTNYSIQIPGYLRIAKDMIENLVSDDKTAAYYSYSVMSKNPYTEKEDEPICPKDVIIKRLIPYKFLQYLLVVYEKTEKGSKAYDKNLADGEDFDCQKYYTSFIKEMGWNNDNIALNEFHRNIIYILKENEALQIFNNDILKDINLKKLAETSGDETEFYKKVLGHFGITQELII